MRKEVVKLDTFDGHLVLLCKGHYETGIDFFEALKRIWEVRCGVSQHAFSGNAVFENIADRMYEMIKKCSPEKLDYFYQIVHRELTSGGFTKPEGMSHIQALIWEYRSVLAMLQIKEKDSNNLWYNLIDLPKPQKQIIKRICRGNGEYADYNKLVKKDTRKAA